MDEVFDAIGILHEPSADAPFLVAEKPHFLPSAGLRQGDFCASEMVARKFPFLRKMKCRSPFDFGLLNRLDCDTCGILLFAASQDSYDFLLQEQKCGRILKKYRAVCQKKPGALQGFPEEKPQIDEGNCVISSFFRPFGEGKKEVRPCRELCKKPKSTKTAYETKILSVRELRKASGRFEIFAELKSGFRHQIRAHLCWAGFPILGDKIYNPESRHAVLELCAAEISFLNPATNKTVHFKC